MIYQVRLGGKIFYDVHAKPFGCCQTKRQCAKPIRALTGGSAIRKKQLLLCPFAAKKRWCSALFPCVSSIKVGLQCPLSENRETKKSSVLSPRSPYLIQLHSLISITWGYPPFSDPKKIWIKTLIPLWFLNSPANGCSTPKEWSPGPGTGLQDFSTALCSERACVRLIFKWIGLRENLQEVMVFAPKN
jgi:hypothetical protein